MSRKQFKDEEGFQEAEPHVNMLDQQIPTGI